MAEETMNAQSNAVFHVKMLGDFGLYRNGVALPTPKTKKACELLVLLAVQHGVPLTRKELAAHLWPGEDHEARMTNLRQQLSLLRKTLGTEADRIQEAKHALFIAPVDLTTDAHNFQTTLDTAQRSGDPTHIEAALALYTGPLFPESAATPVRALRDQLQDLYFNAAETLAARLMQSAQPAQAMALLQRALQRDPCRETVVLLLLKLLEEAPVEAETLFNNFREARIAANRWPPDVRLLHLYGTSRIVARQRSGIVPAEGETAPVPVAGRLLWIPVPLNSIIGREQEVAAIGTTLLHSRLVTLTGPGGVGKTRAAIAALASWEFVYRDGVLFVDLSGLPVDAPTAAVAQKVASTLGLADAPGMAALRTIIASLSPQHLLLVLDNCEQVLPACVDLVSALLSRCPHLTLLATSRESLQVAGEALVPIHPLSLPARHTPETVDSLRRSQAVRLFVERAALRRPGFQLTPENSRAVARICHALDGLPLKLEFAASMLESLQPNQLAANLEGRFSDLAGMENAALSERHRSLEAVIDWSYNLLTPEQRKSMRALAVFCGGWTLEAAEAVCATPNILAQLHQLVAKSLVTPGWLSCSARYRLLQTVRWFCLRRLASAGHEEKAVRQRHLDYFAAWVKQASAGPSTDDRLEWAERLEQEHDNLLAALSWSRQQPSTAATGLEMAVRLSHFWLLRGHFESGACELAACLASCPDADPALRARALSEQGTLTLLADSSSDL
jgi:predicted ATPase/DNA-binding SARP family transcriptional activator